MFQSSKLRSIPSELGIKPIALFFFLVCTGWNWKISFVYVVDMHPSRQEQLREVVTCSTIVIDSRHSTAITSVM